MHMKKGLATVFPQAIGLGAACDEDMQLRMATAISDEARAKHQDFARKGKRLSDDPKYYKTIATIKHFQ